ncbi:anthrone oxygenase family protein [Arenibacterium sp. CAU 1754]
MKRALPFLALASLLFSGAIFGFFYAWVCSTMWGLDQADPRTAIAAMQAMNASVRNATFAPAFFGTPFVLLLTGLIARGAGHRGSALYFGLGGLVYLFGGMILTMAVNVPMNEALATVSVPQDIELARQIWQDYSQPWQVWNQVRTVASGAALLLAGLGTMNLRAT